MADPQARWHSQIRGVFCGGAIGIAVLGSLLGGLFGTLGGYLANLTYDTLKPPAMPLPLWGTMLQEGVALGLLGSGIGLALGLSRGRAAVAGRYLFSGGLAGIAAAFLYTVLVSLAWAGGQTELVVPPETITRAIWIGVFAPLLGLILAGTGGKQTIPQP